MVSVILLNADYQTLGVISLKKAIKLLLKGKAEVVKLADGVISTVKEKILIPAVIRLIKMVRILFGRRVPFSKRNVMVLYGFRCAYCGKKDRSGLTLDHIIPKSRGGKTDFLNVVPSCVSCNCKKDNRTPREAGMSLVYKPISPTINEFLQIQITQLGLDKTLKEIGLM